MTPADVKVLLVQLGTGVSNYLREQGPTVSLALIFTAGVAWFGVWCVKTLISGKQAEIDRITAERDKYVRLVLGKWEEGKKKGSGNE